MATMPERWQEWAGFVLGLWLAISPWVAGYADHEAATANAVFVGLAVALNSHFQATLGECRGEWLTLAAGLWLILAPLLLGFGAQTVATATAVSVGGFIAGLAGSALSLVKQDLH